MGGARRKEAWDQHSDELMDVALDNEIRFGTKELGEVNVEPTLVSCQLAVPAGPYAVPKSSENSRPERAQGRRKTMGASSSDRWKRRTAAEHVGVRLAASSATMHATMGIKSLAATLMG